MAIFSVNLCFYLLFNFAFNEHRIMQFHHRVPRDSGFSNSKLYTVIYRERWWNWAWWNWLLTWLTNHHRPSVLWRTSLAKALNKTVVGKTAFFCKLLLYWSKCLHVLLQLVFNRTVSLKEDPGKSVWRPGEVGVNCVPCTLVVSIYSFILCIAARTLLTWINSKITF